MKRSSYLIIVLVLIAAAIVAAVFAVTNKHDEDKKTPPVASKTSALESSSKKACQIFTLADAKKILGNSAKGGVVNTSSSTDDLLVSSCSYTQGSGSNTPVSSSQSATLLVRAPKNSRGEQSNQNQFGPLKPDDAQDVSGYGQSAYWDAQFGQLNILKNNTWYILSYGPVVPANRTLEQTQQLADLLINKM